MTRENLATFKNENNVTKVTSDNGNTSYLTQSVSFAEEANRLGAAGLVPIETEKKHVLFLVNKEGAEVSRYYLCKNLQGTSADELIENRHSLIFFKSYDPNAGSWVPCVSETSQEPLATKARYW